MVLAYRIKPFQKEKSQKIKQREPNVLDNEACDWLKNFNWRVKLINMQEKKLFFYASLIIFVLVRQQNMLRVGFWNTFKPWQFTYISGGSKNLS